MLKLPLAVLECVREIRGISRPFSNSVALPRATQMTHEFSGSPSRHV